MLSVGRRNHPDRDAGELRQKPKEVMCHSQDGKSE